MSASATKTFTGLGQTGRLQGRRFLAVIGSDGASSFTAVVQLKWIGGDGAVHTLTGSDGTDVSLTVNNQMVAYDFGVNVTAYLECTSYTSGPVAAYLAVNPLSHGC
jgi:hypothetical protein